MAPEIQPIAGDSRLITLPAYSTLTPTFEYVANPEEYCPRFLQDLDLGRISHTPEHVIIEDLCRGKSWQQPSFWQRTKNTWVGGGVVAAVATVAGYVIYLRISLGKWAQALTKLSDVASAASNLFLAIARFLNSLRGPPSPPPAGSGSPAASGSEAAPGTTSPPAAAPNASQQTSSLLATLRERPAVLPFLYLMGPRDAETFLALAPAEAAAPAFLFSRSLFVTPPCAP